MDAGPMVHLTTADSAFHARVLAARLGADGILTELRGEPSGLYPVPAAVEVWVPVDEFETARDLLRADSLEAAMTAPSGVAAGRSPVLASARLLAVIVLVSFCAALAVHALTRGG